MVYSKIAFAISTKRVTKTCDKMLWRLFVSRKDRKIQKDQFKVSISPTLIYKQLLCSYSFCLYSFRDGKLSKELLKQCWLIWLQDTDVKEK